MKYIHKLDQVNIFFGIKNSFMCIQFNLIIISPLSTKRTTVLSILRFFNVFFSLADLEFWTAKLVVGKTSSPTFSSPKFFFYYFQSVSGLCLINI